VRTVIQEVVADIDDNAAEVILVVHWMGGIHTEIRLPRRRRGQRNSTSPDIIAAVRLLVRIANDDLIAGILNRNKLLTGHGNRWSRERVTALCSHHRIPVWRPAAHGQFLLGPFRKKDSPSADIASQFLKRSREHATFHSRRASTSKMGLYG
jgi:hypothetical protein